MTALTALLRFVVDFFLLDLFAWFAAVIVALFLIGVIIDICSFGGNGL